MKKSLKRKVISVVTALSMTGTMGATMASAANTFTNTQGYTYVEGKATVYTDKYGNTIYNGKGYIIDSYGHKINESNGNNYFFDYDGNAVITNSQHQHYDYGYNNYYDQYGNYNYNNSYNPNAHVNVDILDPNVLQRYIQAHQANCQNPACIQNNHQDYFNDLYGYNNNYNYNNYPQYNDNYNNYNEYPQYNDYDYENGQLYTLVKYKNGKAVYAYSATDNVRQFGFEGWIVNSEYNANDYNLNSVFYEEAHTFGNNFYWNDDIMNKIMANSGLYVLKYQTYDGIKYCLSPIREVPGFEYNSKFNPYNDLSNLKTAEAVAARGLTRVYR